MLSSKYKKIFLILTLSILFINCLTIPTYGFGDPIFTDGTGDGLPDEDMKYLWVSNNETHLKFKAELVGTFHETAGTTIFAGISVSNVTGSNFSVYDIKIDYVVHFQSHHSSLQVKLLDINNGTNDLQYANAFGMAYYILSNNNHTLEWGYKLKTYNETGGVGFLNVSINQTINLQFTAGIVGTDFAPNLGAGWITYQLKSGEAPSAPVLDWPEGPPGPIEPTNNDGIINLNWSDIDGATTYYVYRDTSNISSVSTLSPITAVPTSNHTDIITVSGTYYYVVVAGNGLGNSSTSNCVYVIVSLFVMVEIPMLFEITPNPNFDGEINLTWTEVGGATAYQVYRDASYINSASGLTPIATVTDLNYTDIVTVNGIYYYTVKEINLTNVGNCRNVTVIIPLVEPILSEITPRPDLDGIIELNWTIVNGSLRYFVFRDSSPITNSSISGLSPINMTIENHYNDIITVDGYYWYAVVAADDFLNSSISNSEFAWVLIRPESPILYPMTADPFGSLVVRLTWSSVDGGTGYYIYRDSSPITSTNNLTPIVYVTAGIGSNETYSDSLPISGVYYYIIVAEKSGINSSISNCEGVEVIGVIPNYMTLIVAFMVFFTVGVLLLIIWLVRRPSKEIRGLMKKLSGDYKKLKR